MVVNTFERNVDVFINGTFYKAVTVPKKQTTIGVTAYGHGRICKVFYGEIVQESRVAYGPREDIVLINSDELFWNGVGTMIYTPKDDRLLKEFSGPMSVSRRRAGLRQTGTAAKRRRGVRCEQRRRIASVTDEEFLKHVRRAQES